MNTNSLLEKAKKYLATGKFEKASDLCKKVLKKDPKNVFAVHLQGMIAFNQDRFNDAVDCYKVVLNTHPTNAEILLEYGKSLRLAKRYCESVTYLSKSLSLNKTQITLLELGLSLADNNNLEEAKIYLHESLSLKPDCVYSIKRLANIAKIENDLDLAISYYEKLITLWPNNIHSYPEIIKTHLQNSNPKKALELCETCLKINPACTGVLAYKYIALSELGNMEELSYLFDTEHYIHKIKATCPSKTINIRQFNEQLTNHILNKSPKTKTPERYTTESGWQTQNGELFTNNRKLGSAMLEVIDNAIKDYLSKIPDDPKHPVSLGTPSETIIKPWAVVLNTNGHQAPHVHPQSWLSGCYYVEIPDDFDSQPNPHAGHIAFGQGEYNLHPITEPKVIILRPEEGVVCMFPSYFWHHTIPLQSSKNRICIAFDVVPTHGWGR